jgi:hypothetical protein
MSDVTRILSATWQEVIGNNPSLRSV